MKVNFGQVLHNLAGLPLKRAEDGEEMTLVSVSTAALLGTHQDEPAITGQEKFDRYQMAEKIYSCPVVEMKAEDIAKIKLLIGKTFGPVVVGPAYEALDGGQSL